MLIVICLGLTFLNKKKLTICLRKKKFDKQSKLFICNFMYIKRVFSFSFLFFLFLQQRILIEVFNCE